MAADPHPIAFQIRRLGSISTRAPLLSSTTTIITNESALPTITHLATVGLLGAVTRADPLGPRSSSPSARRKARVPSHLSLVPASPAYTRYCTFRGQNIFVVSRRSSTARITITTKSEGREIAIRLPGSKKKARRHVLRARAGFLSEHGSTHSHTGQRPSPSYVFRCEN